MYTNLEQENVLIDNILLDPNNPRFYKFNLEKVEEEFFEDERVQNSILEKIQNTSSLSLDDLIESIYANGFLTIESILVRPYKFNDTKFVVIEGNRRIAAIKTILQQIPINKEIRSLQDDLKEIEVLIFRTNSEDDESELDHIDIRILQGMRHISGPKEWGAYQKAVLIGDLYEKYGLEFREISKRLGFKSRETSRYFRTLKVLNQMNEDEEYGDYAESSLFSLFEEAMKKPPIREWLGWEFKTIDESREDISQLNKETDFNNLYIFYSLITEANETDSPIITNPNLMRKFSDLISYDKKFQINKILEGRLSVEEAHFEAFPKEKISITEILNSTIERLNDTTLTELKNLTESQKGLLENLKLKIESLLEDYSKIATE